MPRKHSDLPPIVPDGWSDDASSAADDDDAYFSPGDPLTSQSDDPADVTTSLANTNLNDDHDKGQHTDTGKVGTPDATQTASTAANTASDASTTKNAQKSNTNMSGSTNTTTLMDDPMDVDPPQDQAHLDLLPSIKGLFRVLDLISENGSGGMVDKIIIAQESLKDLINTLSPGAYASLTKVNFKALDKVLVKPLGIYGSKSEIVDFLASKGAIDEETSRALMSPWSDTTPHLRSGLYVLRASDPQATDAEQLFVIYWPEPTTWEDAVSGVRRNRVTFMRYLTKICDQTVCLVSPEHSRAIVWSDEPEELFMDVEDEGSDRLFTFEVAKTNEQEEDVSVHPGFTMSAPLPAIKAPPPDSNVDVADLQPTLVPGETALAIMTKTFVPGEHKEKAIYDQTYYPTQLRSMLATGTIRFTAKVSDEGLDILGEHGLQSRFPELFKEWKARNAEAVKIADEGAKQEQEDALKKVNDEEASLEPVVREAVIDQLIQMFPLTTRATLSSISEDELSLLRGRYESFAALYPDVKEEINKLTNGGKAGEKYERFSSPEFRDIKDRILCLEGLFAERPQMTIPERQDIVDHVTEVGFEALTQAYSMRMKDSKEEKSSRLQRFMGFVSSLVVSPDEHTNLERKVRSRMQNRKQAMTDGVFVMSLDEMANKEPLLQPLCTRAFDLAQDYLREAVPNTVRTFVGKATFIQQSAIKKQVQHKKGHLRDELLRDSRDRFVEDYEKAIGSSDDATFIIEKVERSGKYSTSFKVSGKFRSLTKPVLRCKVYPLRIRTDDRHNLQSDSTFVPTPHVTRNDSESFDIALDCRILLAQLLDKDRMLLVLADPDVLYIYYEPLSSLHAAVARGRGSAKRTFHREKIGRDVVLAYDEQRRMLALCSASNLQLHISQFDESFANLQVWGAAFDLRPWYAGSVGVGLVKLCFVGGCEELLLLDTTGQARIFSLVTQQFRPASLPFSGQVPDTLQSSPDGACLIVSSRDDDKIVYRSFHWDTFGSSEGIDLGELELPKAPAILTSFVNRRNVHVVALDQDNQFCCSVVLDIKKKVTEFMFKETGGKASVKAEKTDSANNSLIEVHAEVWTRFPVVAAVQRQTISSSSRRPRQLLFVAEQNHEKYSPHFSELVSNFELRTRKPTGDALKNVRVSAVSPLAFYRSLPTLLEDELSVIKAGEWVVDLLCLIPIQIAVTRDNRFLPLKDGVVSAELERSLLGAEVAQIVDSLSFGWFESVFQSYMTSKPVKVVSSMGEQSVGKSYSLNHLCDTSFAGSAMRTTEGVWMAVTPTDAALVVALDFEGVHSIERSAQEDTLLVLFNTALSNLVLFRNNFALSRSISGLFQSFQSSSTILDPAANPGLFRSTLAIIIKDVVESDKNEIVREFKTKFQKIVEDEQDANFISRLHAGQLHILPWPVIESKQFYALFPLVKKQLDKQKVTHRTAGEFLHTIKTLMAKLKANDWGALSQNLAAHRSQKLLNGLTNALCFGLFEVDPEDEPLKNFDTDELIDKPDTAARFFLSDKDSSLSQREAALGALQKSWDQMGQRHHCDDAEWFEGLTQYLNNIVDMRIEHVREWIASNLSRFTESQAAMEALRRVFEASIVDLRANVEVCGTQCSGCQLKCMRSGRHPQSVPHDCGTDHVCPHNCDFGDDEHPDGEQSKHCGLPAGHTGRHICAVDVHLCGEPCVLKDRPGCLGRCMKPAAHDDGEHHCTARIHKCGEPCGLKNVKLPNGKLFSCTKTCSAPSDEPHTEHVCDSASCPIACELCKRLCTETEHLHGLDKNAVHLCGQSHDCSALCQSQGTCEIETAPQSIEATFTGRHETFQYTKYSQAAKRLRCVFKIPPGEKAHTGPHCHSADPNPFHYCETRCENCGYFCTLPRGHPQQEHETRHGSMSRTQWTVDGPEGTIVELNGRKFGANDEGSPLLCSLYCQDMGRHAHLDYCRADDAGACTGAEIEHIKKRILPNPDRPKDWVSHSLFWRRSGFKDPYSRPDQLNFSKCDAMCPDTDHAGDGTNPPNPSYCTLPLFHAPATQAAGLGYLSNDGHVFNCKNPAVLQNAFHVIFAIDRSGSMAYTDRRPLANAPGTALISRHSDNRLGAVYSALHAFWMSRNTALNAGAQRTAGTPVRRDAYSVVLFDHTVATAIANDFTSSPDQLLAALLRYRADGGTNFALAIQQAQRLMETHWSTERTPVVIFLSDGECSIDDETMRTISRRAVALGKPLSFHSVSFGPASSSTYLRRMAQVALEVQNNAPRDPLVPAAATIASSYSEALDTVRLAETFLGFAESLRKPRGALMSSTK